MILHPNYDPLLSLKDAAAYLAMSPTKLSQLARMREIEFVREGDPWSSRARLKFRLSAINAWVKRYTIPARGLRRSASKVVNDGFIYFAQISGAHREIRNYIKIDYCYSIKEAKTALRTDSPFPLALVAVVPGTRADLALLAARFESLRAPDGDCWYRPAGDLMEFLEALPNPKQRP